MSFLEYINFNRKVILLFFSNLCLIFQIVAFSFYGNPNSEQGKSRKYFQGIKDNLKEVPIFYPDWTLRLYYDLEDSHPLMKELCDLACNDPNIGKYRLMSVGLSTYYNYTNISMVLEFQRWWVLKSKTFGQESI